MRLWTREQAGRIDRRTIDEGFSNLDQLVKAAGLGLAQEIRRIVEPRQSLVFLIGPGLNGADGWTAALDLMKDHPITVYFFEKKPSELWKDCRARWETLALAQTKPAPMAIDLKSESQLKGILKSEVIVDCLFGTGLDRDFDSDWMSWIAQVNELPNVKIAADLPSGLDANTGWSRGAAFHCQWTITFGAPKPGLFIQEGPWFAGRIRVVPLPFPKRIVQAEASSVFTYGAKLMKKLLPKVEPHSHKYRNGQVHLICGSEKYRGAAVLAARGALRLGAGFVHLHHAYPLSGEELAVPEVLFHPLSEQDLISALPSAWQGHSWVVGPGLEDSQFGLRALQWLRHQNVSSVVVDATALKSLSNWAGPLTSSWIITPHSGEAAELLGTSSAVIERDRLWAARTLAEKWKCIVVLKGPRSLIATPKRVTINRTGNAGLAKAGSGDVLAGFIGSLLTKMPPIRAAHLGVWIHGALADQWVGSGRDLLSLTPSDLLEGAPEYLRNLRHRRS